MKIQSKNLKGPEKFEFCSICKLNHSHGRRHVYFPSHKNSVQSVLSRFEKKLSDIRFFVSYPLFLRPEHAAHNRLWCTFCELDISESKSLFACENIIKHLVSIDHLKSLKDFLGKYGGRKDQLDSLRLTDEEFKKWEAQCASLRLSTISSDRAAAGDMDGQPKDIHHHDLNYLEKVASYSNQTLDSNLSKVLPLQCYTNENFQVSSTISVYNKGAGNHMQSSASNGVKMLEGAEASSHGPGSCSHCLATISCSSSEKSVANVHSGAPPPWLRNEDSGIALTSYGSYKTKKTHRAVSNQCQGARKLNPKRVGAAWAEQRKAELEREKKGEIVATKYDSNWLPDFGRVWQYGTRKESRKEFEKEKGKTLKVKNVSDLPTRIEPYISKRMKMESTK